MHISLTETEVQEALEQYLKTVIKNCDSCTITSAQLSENPPTLGNTNGSVGLSVGLDVYTTPPKREVASWKETTGLGIGQDALRNFMVGSTTGNATSE